MDSKKVQIVLGNADETNLFTKWIEILNNFKLINVWLKNCQKARQVHYLVKYNSITKFTLQKLNEEKQKSNQLNKPIVWGKSD